MSFTTTGFQIEAYADIVSRIYNNFKDVLPSLNFTADNLITHWQEIMAAEDKNSQMRIQEAINNFSVGGATGIYLNNFGDEAGLYRKGAHYSYGDVVCTGPSDGDIIPISTKFATDGNKEYIATESVTMSKYIPINKSATMEDVIPNPFSNIGISGLYPNASPENPISNSDYSYANDTITWSNTGTTTEGVQFYLLPSGNISVDVAVKSTVYGSSGNTELNTIIINSDNISYIEEVTNPISFSFGADTESDKDWRYRLKRATRKTFSFGRVYSLVTQLDGVKGARVYQVTNSDNSTLSNWEYVTGWTGVTSEATGWDWLAFSFYPSADIATLGEVVLHGRTHGTPPKLNAYIKDHSSGKYVTGLEDVYKSAYIEQTDLDRDEYNTWQDIKIPLKYNGIDSTKTYGVYLYQSGADATNTWGLSMQVGITSNDYRNQTATGHAWSTTEQLNRKTMYKAPAYNIEVVPREGYTFSEIEDSIEGLLDYVDQEGNSPVCIQYNINEATKVYLSLSVKIYVEKDRTFSVVTSEITDKLDLYLDSLIPGENVIYSQIEKIILNVDGVLKESDLRLNIDGGTWVTRETENDISISDNEYVSLNTATLSYLEG